MVADLLNATAEMTRTAESPTDSADTQRLLDALHDIDEALDGLHDRIGCAAPLDRHGRCIDCGRLVARHQEHEKRGCAALVPILGQYAWLKAHAHLVLSVPFLGKALFLARRSLATGAFPRTAGGGEAGGSSLTPAELSAPGSIPRKGE